MFLDAFKLRVTYFVIILSLSSVSISSSQPFKAPADKNRDEKAISYKSMVGADLITRQPNGSLANSTCHVEEQPKVSSIKSNHSGLIKSNFALIGTVCSRKFDSYAVIMERATEKQKLYRIGEIFQNGIIWKINRDDIVILYDGKEIVLKASLNNGLSITFIKPGSIFYKSGLQAGDVLKEVSGTPIKNSDLLAALYQRIKSFPIEFTFEDFRFVHKLNWHGLI